MFDPYLHLTSGQHSNCNHISPFVKQSSRRRREFHPADLRVAKFHGTLII